MARLYTPIDQADRVWIGARQVVARYSQGLRIGFKLVAAEKRSDLIQLAIALRLAVLVKLGVGSRICFAPPNTEPAKQAGAFAKRGIVYGHAKVNGMTRKDLRTTGPTCLCLLHSHPEHIRDAIPRRSDPTPG